MTLFVLISKKENMAQLPALNEAQEKKLKVLSITTLSESQQVLPYDMLQSYLDIPTVRALEDLIIDAFYQGVFSGKLDQRHRQLQVVNSIGRDVQFNNNDTLETLAAWGSHTTRLMAALDAKIASLQDTIQANEQAQEAYISKVEQLRRDIRENTTNLMKVSPTMDESAIKKKGYTGEHASPDERVKKR